MLETPFKNIPENLHMMQHVYRSQYDQHTKCLFNTDTILSVQQHFIQSCIVSGQCGFDYVHGGVGQYCYYITKLCYPQVNCSGSPITALPHRLWRLWRLWGEGVHQWSVPLQGHRRQRDGNLEILGGGGEELKNRPGQYRLWMKRYVIWKHHQSPYSTIFISVAIHFFTQYLVWVES